MTVLSNFLVAFFLIVGINTATAQEVTFDWYPAMLFEGPLAEPDFSTNPKAEQFKTRIIAACADGINFAGHYTLVTMGCGTACQFGMVVDRKTGAIYDGFTSELGYDFRDDSSLLIKNPEALAYTQDELDACSYCKLSYWIWEVDQFYEMEE